MYSKTISILSLLCLATLFACNGQKKKGSTEIKTKADSVAYAIGASIGGNMQRDGLDSLNLDILKMGMSAAIHGDSLLFDQMMSQGIIQSYLQEKEKSKGDAALAEGTKFLAENKTKPGVVELPSGLQYQVITEGTGAMPSVTDTVNVTYKGTFINGTEFDGGTTEYPVSGFIKGWQDALQMMKAGSKWKLFVPPSLGYGERGYSGKIPGNSTLIFEMELHSVKGK